MCKRKQCGWHMTPVTWIWKDQAFAQSKENNKTRAKNAVTQNRDCWAKQAQQKTKQVMHKDVKTSKPRQRRMRMSGIKQPTNINHRILNICSWSVARRLWMTIWADLRWCTTTRRTGRWCRCEGDRGFPPRKCIADSKWRQLFLFHDNRVCHDQTILFQHAANMQHHHAARGQQICTCWHKSQTGVIRCIQNRDGITQFQRGTREGSRQPEE